MFYINTQGWIRGYIAHNSQTDKFVKLVITTISKEFECEFHLIDDLDNFILHLGEYEVIIDKDTAEKLQRRSPYALDKHILNILQEQGLEFDKKRSQYIRYCYDIFKI